MWAACGWINGKPDSAADISISFLTLTGVVAGGVMLARITQADPQKERVTGCYVRHVLPRYLGFTQTILRA